MDIINNIINNIDIQKFKINILLHYINIQDMIFN